MCQHVISLDKLEIHTSLASPCSSAINSRYSAVEWTECCNTNVVPSLSPSLYSLAGSSLGGVRSYPNTVTRPVGSSHREDPPAPSLENPCKLIAGCAATAPSDGSGPGGLDPARQLGPARTCPSSRPRNGGPVGQGEGCCGFLPAGQYTRDLRTAEGSWRET